MKKLLALLLALAMVFSLAACASSGKDADDDGRDTPEESAAPAPDAAEDDARTDDSLRAFAERYDDMGNALPEFDTAGLLAAIAPHLEHEALAEALQLVYKVGIFTEEQFFDALDYAKPRETLLKTYGGDYRIETTMTEAEPLDEARMDEILDLLAAELDDYTRLVQFGEEATDAEVREASERDGLTVEQELRLIELYRIIRDSLADCEITEGYAVTLSNEISGSLYDGVDTRTGHITVIKLNGEWMLLDGLLAFSCFHADG